MGSSLLMMCVISFTAVFTLLAVLATVMRVITAAFPARPAPALPAAAPAESDAAVMAAITTTMNKIYPGAQVTKIEEVK